jgi:acetylcholinesterase
VFGVGELGESLVRFATNLNPESESLSWPKFDPSSRNVLTLYDFTPRVGISQDNYRQEAMEYLTQVTLAHPI